MKEVIEVINYLESFEDFLVEAERSEGTIGIYVRDAKEFMEFVKGDLQGIDKKTLIRFKDHLKKQTVSVKANGEMKEKLVDLKTVNRKLASLSKFIEFLNESFDFKITAKVKREKITEAYSFNDDELLTEVDYNKLIKAVVSNNDIRTKAMFETLYHTGMRVSEMLQLELQHINLRTIETIKGKGSKQRIIFMREDLHVVLNEYLEQRPKTHSTKLFTGQRGAVNRQTVHNLLKKYAKLAGVEEKKAHAHNLRHLFCIRAAQKGFTIDEIAKLAGHEDTNTTRIYLEKPKSYYYNKINEM